MPTPEYGYTHSSYNQIQPGRTFQNLLAAIVGSQLSSDAATRVMPPVRSARNRKPPPDGFDDLEDTLLEFANRMKDVENASHEGKKRHEVLWPIFQISHQRKSFPSMGMS